MWDGIYPHGFRHSSWNQALMGWNKTHRGSSGWWYRSLSSSTSPSTTTLFGWNHGSFHLVLMYAWIQMKARQMMAFAVITSPFPDNAGCLWTPKTRSSSSLEIRPPMTNPGSLSQWVGSLGGNDMKAATKLPFCRFKSKYLVFCPDDADQPPIGVLCTYGQWISKRIGGLFSEKEREGESRISSLSLFCFLKGERTRHDDLDCPSCSISKIVSQKHFCRMSHAHSLSFFSPLSSFGFLRKICANSSERFSREQISWQSGAGIYYWMNNTIK